MSDRMIYVFPLGPEFGWPIIDIQRDLEAGILVWAPKVGTQRSFLVQYILSSIRSDK